MAQSSREGMHGRIKMGLFVADVQYVRMKRIPHSNEITLECEVQGIDAKDAANFKYLVSKVIPTVLFKNFTHGYTFRKVVLSSWEYLHMFGRLDLKFALVTRNEMEMKWK